MAFACKYCIASKGLRGSDIASLPQTQEDLIAHIEGVRMRNEKPAARDDDRLSEPTPYTRCAVRGWESSQSLAVEGGSKKRGARPSWAWDGGSTPPQEAPGGHDPKTGELFPGYPPRFFEPLSPGQRRRAEGGQEEGSERRSSLARARVEAQRKSQALEVSRQGQSSFADRDRIGEARDRLFEPIGCTSVAREFTAMCVSADNARDHRFVVELGGACTPPGRSTGWMPSTPEPHGGFASSS
jgi:hypothetical protein